MLYYSDRTTTPINDVPERSYEHKDDGTWHNTYKLPCRYFLPCGRCARTNMPCLSYGAGCNTLTIKGVWH